MYCRVLALLAAFALLAQTGCTRGTGSAADDTIADPVVAEVLSPPAMAGAETGALVDPSSLSSTELQFGRAPKPDPSVTFQSGVIVMEHGDQAIASMESNGIVWHFKTGAPQVDQIQEDSVIFATERCVGRVLHVDRSGDDVRVVLGPVQVTDIFAKAHFSLDQPLDLTKAIAVSAPDFPAPTPEPETSAAPGTSATPGTSAVPTAREFDRPARLLAATYSIVSPNGTWHRFRAVTYDSRGVAHAARVLTARRVPERVAQALPPLGLPPGVNAPIPGTDIPPVEIDQTLGATPCLIKCGGLGLEMTYDKDGVKIYGSAVLYLQNPRAKVNLNIDQGVRSTGIHLAGIAGFRAHFELGADKTFSHNVHIRGEIPLDLMFLVNTLTPVSVHFTQVLLLDTGFSARTSVLAGTFDYSICCSVGVGYNGTGVGGDAPQHFSAKNDVPRDVTGISVGINSFRIALRQQVLLGFGILGFATGPYVGVAEGSTLLKQSSIATPLMVPVPGAPDIGCRQATFDFTIDGGVGWTIPHIITKVVNFFLGLFHSKPLPSSGSFIKIPERTIIDQKFELPSGCSG